MNTNINTVHAFLKAAEDAKVNTLRQLSVFMSCAQRVLTTSQLKSEYDHICSHVVDVQRRLLDMPEKQNRKAGIGLLKWGELRDTGGPKREREIKLTARGMALHKTLLTMVYANTDRPYDEMIDLMSKMANDHGLETCNQLLVVLAVYLRNNQTLDRIFNIPLDDTEVYHKMTSRMPGFMIGEMKSVKVQVVDEETGEPVLDEKGKPLMKSVPVRRPGLEVLEWGERPDPSLGYHHRIHNVRITDKGRQLVSVVDEHFNQFGKAA